MTTPKCRHCGQSKPELQALVHPPTGETLRLCVPCLRGMAHAKAAWSDERGRTRLVKTAEKNDQEVWRSDQVVYLLPRMTEDTEHPQPQNKPPNAVGER